MPSPVVQLRVPAELLARIDGHRGDVTRSAWILAACEAALNPKWMGPLPGPFSPILPVPADDPPPVLQAGRKGKAPVVQPEQTSRPARQRCPHPGTRVIGGYCRQCDVVVGQDGYLPEGVS